LIFFFFSDNEKDRKKIVRWMIEIQFLKNIILDLTYECLSKINYTVIEFRDCVLEFFFALCIMNEKEEKKYKINLRRNKMI